MTFNCTRHTALPCMCPGCQTMTTPTHEVIAAAERLRASSAAGASHRSMFGHNADADYMILGKACMSLLAARSDDGDFRVVEVIEDEPDGYGDTARHWKVVEGSGIEICQCVIPAQAHRIARALGVKERA